MFVKRFVNRAGQPGRAAARHPRVLRGPSSPPAYGTAFEPVRVILVRRRGWRGDAILRRRGVVSAVVLRSKIHSGRMDRSCEPPITNEVQRPGPTAVL